MSVRWPDFSTPRAERAGWLVVIVIAGLTRLVGITSSLPYLAYVDEGHVLHPTITLLKSGSWDPKDYLYPSLTYYLIAGAATVIRPFYRLAHGHSLLSDLPGAETYYDFVSPPELILAGRFVVAILSILTVLVAGLLARRLGGPRAGLLAGVFVALCPALVSRGTIVIVDTVGAFFVVLALFFAHFIGYPPVARSRRTPSDRPRLLSEPLAGFLAGASSGCALTAKYTLAAVFGAVLATIALRQSPMRDRIRLAVIAAFGLLAGAVVTMPALVLRFRGVMDALRDQSRFYSSPIFLNSRLPGQSYFAQMLTAREVGIVLTVSGVAGVLWMVSRRSDRLTALSWLGFAALLLAPLVRLPFQPFRNLLALVPLLCISGALVIVNGLESGRFRTFAVATTLVLTATLARPASSIVQERIALVDSRRSAVDWLVRHVRPYSDVLIEQELAILPSELKRIPAIARVASRREIPEIVDSGRFDYVAAGPVDLLETRDPESLRDQECWEAWLHARSPEVSFGRASTPVYPNFWRSNSELVHVFGADRFAQAKLSFSWLLPAAARDGRSTGYRTSLTLANKGSAEVACAVRYLAHDTDGTAGPQKSFTLGPGTSVTYADVLGKLFGVDDGYGAIQIRASASTLRITGETCASSVDGRKVCQSVPAFGREDLIVRGKPRSIDSIREDAVARTNLALANATGATIDVEVALFSGSGDRLGLTRVSLQPHGMTQFARVARETGLRGDLTGGRLELSTLTPDGAFAGYASVIDNATGEPRALLPR